MSNWLGPPLNMTIRTDLARPVAELGSPAADDRPELGRAVATTPVAPTRKNLRRSNSYRGSNIGGRPYENRRGKKIGSSESILIQAHSSSKPLFLGRASFRSKGLREWRKSVFLQSSASHRSRCGRMSCRHSPVEQTLKNWGGSVFFLSRVGDSTSGPVGRSWRRGYHPVGTGRPRRRLWYSGRP